MRKLFACSVLAIVSVVGAAYLVRTLRTAPAGVPIVEPPPEPLPQVVPAPSAAPEASSQSTRSTADKARSRPAGDEASLPEAGMVPLTCSPTRVQRGDTLTIRPSKAHRELAIQSPSGRFFQLIESAPADPGQLPLISADEFQQLTSLELSIAELRGPSVQYGVTDVIAVFEEPGAYEILVGEALAGGVGTFEQCTVQFVDK
jgi:hypothetical protein